METRYSFVVDGGGPFGYQGYLLARSLIEFGEIPPERITAHIVNGAHPTIDRSLRSTGIETKRIDPFGHPYCNRLQQFESLAGSPGEPLVLLDADMFAIRPLAVPQTEKVMGKAVDAPVPPIERLSDIFRSAGVEMIQSTSDVIPQPTARANFNGGLYVIPANIRTVLAEAWIHWARWCLEHLDLFDKWWMHVDQVSFALAVAERSIPIAELPREFNTPTHLGPQAQSEPPRLLHYHRHVDSQLLLKPTGDGTVDAAIATANSAILNWRRHDLQNDLFWTARYSIDAQLGSGVGSRGVHLERKREVIRRLISLLAPHSVVDIGGGDGAALQSIASEIEHRAIDVAPGAEQEYLQRNPQAKFEVADITEEPVRSADMAICLDLLLHVGERDAYLRGVRNILASGTRAVLVSGYDAVPRLQSSLTHYHEPLLKTVQVDPTIVAFPVLVDRESVAYLLLRVGDGAQARDASANTLRYGVLTCGNPSSLLECVVVARRELGFFPEHVGRTIEYPWVLDRIRALDRTGLRIGDIGAGVNVLPLLLSDDGHRLFTVDAHGTERSVYDRRSWTEWGYLDYSQLRRGIASANVDYEVFTPPCELDVIYSVSVLEHVSAEARRRWLARMESQLAPGGRLLLTLDILPMSRDLWVHNEGAEVEPSALHGTVDDVEAELRQLAFTVDESTMIEWIPTHPAGLALIAATKDTPPSPSPREVTVPGFTRKDRSIDGRGTVTVLVPAYRPNHRFDATMRALAAQTYPDLLIRVSLDHAPDHPDPVLPPMNGKATELIHQPRRLGWVGHVNALLATVRTPYFLLNMHDDCLTPTYVHEAVNAMVGRPEVAVAHGAVRYHGIHDGEVLSTESLSGSRLERVLTFIERGPHRAGLGWRGVVRSELLASGLRLRARRSDGMFSNDLIALEMIAHGESVALRDVYYDKYTDAGGLSRAYHGRSLQERSAMLADNLACLIDVLVDTGFDPDEQAVVAQRYAEWLLGIQGNWNVAGDVPNSDAETYASIRPAIAQFVANTALSMTSHSMQDPTRRTHDAG